MHKTPPLRAIQAFESFGRLGSVTEAAAELGVSVGAISQQLRKAEEAIGIRLLERRGRSIALTSRGQLYHADISAGFDMIRAAQEKIETVRSENVLTISCLPSLASKWVGSQLFDWQASHPHASVRLIGDDAEPRFGDDQVDFRITYGNRVAEFDHYVELFTDRAVPACSPGFLARNRLQKPSDILDHPLLGIEWARVHGAPPSWAEWAASIGISYRRTSGEVAFSLSSAAIDAAINGKGFVLAQLSMAADDINAGRLVVPFNHRIKLPEPYFLAWDRAALEKSSGPDLRAWIISISKRQEAVSKNFTPPATTSTLP